MGLYGYEMNSEIENRWTEKPLYFLPTAPSTIVDHKNVSIKIFLLIEYLVFNTVRDKMLEYLCWMQSHLWSIYSFGIILVFTFQIQINFVRS